MLLLPLLVLFSRNVSLVVYSPLSLPLFLLVLFPYIYLPCQIVPGSPFRAAHREDGVLREAFYLVMMVRQEGGGDRREI